MREADTLNAVAAKHGVHPSQLREWRRQAEASMIAGFRDGRRKAEADQSAALKEAHAKIGQLTLEKDFFCRALGR